VFAFSSGFSSQLKHAVDEYGYLDSEYFMPN